jgi:hypothetical protein
LCRTLLYAGTPEYPPVPEMVKICVVQAISRKMPPGMILRDYTQGGRKMSLTTEDIVQTATHSCGTGDRMQQVNLLVAGSSPAGDILVYEDKGKQCP